MPLRALGYLTSAVHVAQAYLPYAQVQMVHTLHTAERVNQVDLRRARQVAEQFAELGGALLMACGMSQDRVTFLTDPAEAAQIDTAGVEAVLEQLPAAARDKLLASGARRGSDVVPYVAAHLQMHDSVAELPPLRQDDAAPVFPRRIISLGAQSERPFYLARMACRTQGVAIPGQVADTAQFFTKHVIPPYQPTAHGSEPPLSDATLTALLSGQLDAAPENLSVARDLAYLQAFAAQGAQEVAAHA
ncbi:MAG TPA: hypothetical protein VLF71_02440 [Candidatus Saccharimonadales bacterium]|nr:hypothetical protein [Candidatus Saccharimonadales bacterium]